MQIRLEYRVCEDGVASFGFWLLIFEALDTRVPWSASKSDEKVGSINLVVG